MKFLIHIRRWAFDVGRLSYCGTCIIILLLSNFVLAENTKVLAEKVKKANELFAEGQLDAAEQQYADAQVDVPENHELHFNLGDVLYKKGQFDKAIAEFENALSTPYPELEAKSHYNIGNCLVQQGKLKEALDAYKRALNLDRDDEDTKYNIEYVQRKMKELASKKKDEQKKDPLHKLLKELEKLINLQAETVVKTKDAVADSTNQAIKEIVYSLATNEQQYAVKTKEISDGFAGLLTNYPPEKLYGQPQQAQSGMPGMPTQPQLQPQISLDDKTRELAGIFQVLAQTSQGLNNCITGSNLDAVSPLLSEAEGVLSKIETETQNPENKKYATEGINALKSLGDAFKSPGSGTAKLQAAGDDFSELMQKMQTELQTRIQAAASAGTNATQKTLAQKINNAIEYLGVAEIHIFKASEILQKDWTNAIPDEVTGLENLIKARKEFDDKNQQQQNKKQDRQQKKQKKDDKKGENKDEKKDNKQDENKDKKKDDKQQQQQKQQQQKQQQQKQKLLDQKQVKRMLNNFKEDQRNKRKARKAKARAAGYMPVDKDW